MTVRVLDGTGSNRRSFLRALAAQGVALPAATFLASGEAKAHIAGEPYSQGAKAGMRHIVREFSEPYIELIRLLRQASEIEHALMVQYLYGGFSVKPAYNGIVGFGVPGSNDLIGVAAMEMQHLRDVNSLLAALGAAPNLIRQGFPFEPEVYPFEFHLEPLTEASVAKYVYCEAAAGSLDPDKASRSDSAFLRDLDRALGANARPNHVGSLYDAIIHTLTEYIASAPQSSVGLIPWVGKLEAIKREGEEGHFQFFKRVFTATHAGFNGRSDAWRLPRRDAAYPSYSLPSNPSAFIGHENQIQDPNALALAWLGNLHYWVILLLADAAYVEKSVDYAGLARVQMLGPFWSLAKHLPKLGAGIPCEPLVIGYAPCSASADRARFIVCMVREAAALAKSLGERRLPSDYPLAVAEVTLGALNEKRGVR